VDEAEREQRPRIVNERIEERRRREEERAQHHHALAAEHIGERARRQLEKDAGDGGCRDNHADELGHGAEIGGEDGQHRSSRHLVAEARKQACEHDRDECVHTKRPD
jgi:hypothetical protein